MYIPIQTERLFTFEDTYDQIDWSDFQTVISFYKKQLEYWYILPGLELKKEGHFGFPVAAISCLLIDCLSQYEEGVTQATKTVFKNYLRNYWTELGQKFPTPIDAQHSGRSFIIEDGADAIYHGVRCGILHEAHVKLYTGLGGKAEETPGIIEYYPSGYAEYVNGTSCPVVVLDPGRLFDAVNKRFNEYIEELKNDDNRFDQTRENFRIKFKASYGIAI